MKKYTVDNKTRSMSGWARLAGVSRQAMASRVRKASNEKEIQAALTAPAGQGTRTDIKPDGR